MGHIPPSCHSSDATDMSHKGSQNQRRHTGSAAFPRGLPNNECLHETAMTGMSWNACDLKIMNSNLKKLCEHTATLTWVTDCTRFHESAEYFWASWTRKYSAFTLERLLSREAFLWPEWTSSSFVGERIFTVLTWSIPQRDFLAVHDFSTAWCQIPGDQGVIWCRMRVPTVMIMLLACQILPSAVALLSACFQFFLWARQSENDTRYDETVGVWDRTHLSLPSVPQRHRPRTGPGQAKSSRTWSADTPGLGWRNAGCSN